MPTAPLHREAGSIAVPAALALLALAAAPLQAQEAPRVRGPGYSVPIPAGFHADSTSGDVAIALWLRGGVTLFPDSSTPASTYIRVSPAGPQPDRLDKPKECSRAGAHLAWDLDGELAGANIAGTPIGRECQVLIVERAAARARLTTFMVDKATAFVAECVYEVTDAGPPDWCRAVIEGWRSEDPEKGPPRIPRWVPAEHSAECAQCEDAVIDEWPQMLASSPPTYPRYLQKANVTGVVTIEAVVGTDGKIEPWSLRIVESPNPGFEPAAADAALSMVFRPGKVNGKPVRVLIQMPIVFQLEGKP